MFSLVKATSPPPRNTSKPSTTMARRVSPNARRAFSTMCCPSKSNGRMAGRNAQSAGLAVSMLPRKTAPSADHQFALLQPVQNLIVAVMLHADLDDALGEVTPIGGHPHRHGAVALAHHAVHRDGRGGDRIACDGSRNSRTCRSADRARDPATSERTSSVCEIRIDSRADGRDRRRRTRDPDRPGP